MIESEAPTVVAESAMAPSSPGGHAFSQWLRAQLKARRLTQRQLAQKSGVDHSTISRLMGGNRVPSLRTASLLARSLGVSVGPGEVGRAGLGSTEPPAARVEYALRLDDLLSEAQVLEIMRVYLAIRWRHRR